MTDIRAQMNEIAQRLSPLCRHISVRDDKRGLCIFAIAEDDVHSLELRHEEGEFSLQLWHGKTAEVERVVEEAKFSDAASATARSAVWLRADAI